VRRGRFSFDGSEVFVEKKNKKTGKMEKVPVYKNPNYNIIEMGFDFPIEKYTDAKAPSTDGTTILHLSKKEYKTARKREGVQLCKKLLEYSKLEKLKTGFVDGIKENIYPDGKIHCNFHPVGTDSGRISCSNINLMQLPNAREDDKYRLRDVFIGDIDPKTGKRKKIISVDESNLEMRVLTHFSQDEALLKAFNNNDDTHGATAVQMFNLPIKPNEVKKHPVYGYLRQIAKIINFMLMYGGGAPTLYDALKEEGVDMDNPQEWAKYTITVKGKTRKVKNGIELAQAYIDRYFKAYSGVAKFIQNQKRFAHRNGLVYTLVGRKRRLPNIQSDNFKVVSYCERLSVNSCIQGSGADIVINAQNKIEYDERLWNLDCEMLIQVHDELICQAPEENAEEAAQIIREHMIHPFGQSVKLNLPLEVGIGIGDSYGTAEH
jgi:DNA polymerase-1